MNVYIRSEHKSDLRRMVHVSLQDYVLSEGMIELEGNNFHTPMCTSLIFTTRQPLEIELERE